MQKYIIIGGLSRERHLDYAFPARHLREGLARLDRDFPAVLAGEWIMFSMFGRLEKMLRSVVEGRDHSS